MGHIAMTQAKARTPSADEKRGARILLVDDHPVVRHGLAQLINEARDLHVCGQASNVAEALEMVASQRPDLVVVDICLQNANGIELIKQIKAQYDDEVKMLVSSMHDESVFAERALQAGAMGYVSKEEATEKIVTAIRQVLEGRTFLSGRMTERLVRRVTHGEAPAVTNSIDTLSDRELEVFELMGRGWTTRKIASELHLSPKTIETYRQHIKTKLGLQNTSELVVRAAEWVLQRK